MFTLGIYISTIYQNLWESLASNLATNGVDFEIVLVGPLKNVSLPKNCRFIHSEAYPAECWHIGAMACNSKYILNMSDDCRFADGSALDRLIANIKTKPHFSIVSPRYTRCSVQTLLPKKEIPWNPVMPVCSLLDKQLYTTLGGFDRRFKNLFWDVDFAMRVYEEGGEVFIDDSVLLEELDDLNHSRLTGKSKSDKKFLYSLWVSKKRNRIYHHRRDVVHSYANF